MPSSHYHNRSSSFFKSIHNCVKLKDKKRDQIVIRVVSLYNLPIKYKYFFILFLLTLIYMCMPSALTAVIRTQFTMCEISRFPSELKRLMFFGQHNRWKRKCYQNCKNKVKYDLKIGQSLRKKVLNRSLGGYDLL